MKNHQFLHTALLGIALFSLIGCASKKNQAITSTNRLAPLKLFWDGRDNYTVATPQGEADAVAKGYKLVRVEGYVFTSQLPGMTALKQYWSETRHDYWLLPRDIPKNVEKNGAYQFVRIEGYVYTNAQPGTVELKHFSLLRGDNFTFASRPAENDAHTANYGQRHLFHAYVIPEMESRTASTAVQPIVPPTDGVSDKAGTLTTNGPAIN